MTWICGLVLFILSIAFISVFWHIIVNICKIKYNSLMFFLWAIIFIGGWLYLLYTVTPKLCAVADNLSMGFE
jgi:hypothetical protein